MSIAAVVSFCGFPELPECHLTLAEEGYPAAVASGFEAARRRAARPAGFLKGFRSIQAQAAPLVTDACLAEACRSEAAYHYRVRLVARRRTPLMVDCWRRYPGGIGWQRRCGPMALERFVERFVPKQPKQWC